MTIIHILPLGAVNSPGLQVSRNGAEGTDGSGVDRTGLELLSNHSLVQDTLLSQEASSTQSHSDIPHVRVS